jgi:23S rRNA (guanine2445-N2)-methyltransferase / 23S rRNA (guanine2069-N7)-methyltransferase
MPEFAFAIDCYGDHIHMQEYKAPASIPDTKAEEHRLQAIAAVTNVLRLEEGQLVLKTRQRQKGKNQYETTDKHGDSFVIAEGAAKLWVNLERYLDTGLFLDHRPIRRFIYGNAQGKRFLNLFCYTATASVQAALGGAESSLSVDLSNTYLDWARRNYLLNNLERTKHRLIQKDCISYLRNSKDQFDLIFLDPPTFSNSKRTDNVLDIQRDHVELISNAMGLLSKRGSDRGPDGGLLIFSTNNRKFKLDQTKLSKFSVEDYTDKSIDRDFQRNSSIHKVWLFRH